MQVSSSLIPTAIKLIPALRMHGTICRGNVLMDGARELPMSSSTVNLTIFLALSLYLALKSINNISITPGPWPLVASAL